jgi:hypothetical protein
MQPHLPTTIAELQHFAMELNRTKYENIPAHAIPKPSFSDANANALTNAVLFDLVNVRGGACYRINNVGVYDGKRGVYRKGGTRKGIPDIVGVIDGRFYGIEIKFGRDRQSADQRVIELEITEAGGVYFIATSFADYVQKMADVKQIAR